MRRGRALVSLLLAGAALATAADGVAEPRRPPAGAPEVRPRTLNADRLVVAVPRGWSSLTQRDVVFPGVVRTITGRHPDLLPLLLGLASPDSPFRLLAFEPHLDAGATTTMTVVVRPLEDGTRWEQWTGEVRRSAASAAGLVGRVSITKERLPSGEALRVEYLRTPRGSTTPVASSQLWLVVGERLVTIELASRPELRGRYTRLLLALGRSVWPAGAERPAPTAPCPPARITCA
jgi:hypothetical protein